MGSSWLIRDGMDRERMFDMDARLGPARRRSFAVLGLVLIACGPWVGWWPVLPLLLVAILFPLAEKRMAAMRRPEYAMFAAWAGAEMIIAASVVLAGGHNFAAIAWLAIPMVTLASRFSDRGIAAGLATALGLLLAVAFGANAQAVIDNPAMVLTPAGLIVAVTMLSVALMQSDVEHRNRAVLDPLTGMLNRAALDTRVGELAQQSTVRPEPVGVIVADIDHFKGINDRHGHQIGDAVLRDLAYVLRRELRAFDLAYRLGGEEFLVLLPGADRAQAGALAEQLRQAVEDELLADGTQVTISCGVAASDRETSFNFERTYAEADEALYESKRSGRNRVSDMDSSRVAVPA
jgi:diguanylate cyclase (GGDEF)-like protein